MAGGERMDIGDHFTIQCRKAASFLGRQVSISLSVFSLLVIAVGVLCTLVLVLRLAVNPKDDLLCSVVVSRAADGSANGTDGSSDGTANNRNLEAQVDSACHMGGIFVAGKDPNAPAATSAKPATLSHLYGTDQAFFPRNFTPIANIVCHVLGSDKRGHFYGHMYSEYLDAMRLQQKSVNLLEIGLGTQGESLKIWEAAFPRGKIYGIELEHSFIEQAKARVSDRVFIFQADQENVARLAEVYAQIEKEVGYLDVIVDDGGHTMGQQITSFTSLFPLLRPGGLYFIEDLQTSYWPTKCHPSYCYGGGPVGANWTAISLLKSLIDVLNADYMEDHPNADGLGTGKYHVNPVDNLVGSVQCWRNMCVVRRKYEGSYF